MIWISHIRITCFGDFMHGYVAWIRCTATTPQSTHLFQSLLQKHRIHSSHNQTIIHSVVFLHPSSASILLQVHVFTKQPTPIITMPIHTRPGASPATPARPLKPGRAKTSSKQAEHGKYLQKLAPVRRYAGGYVWIDEGSHMVDDDTARAASPEYSFDTPLPSRRVIPGTRPPFNQQTQTPPVKSTCLGTYYATCPTSAIPHQG